MPKLETKVGIISVAILIIQLFLIPAWGREGTDKELIYDFAESLLSEGDYFRAIGEYKRYIFLHPADELTENSHFRIADAYFKAKRWPEAIDACNQFLDKYPYSIRYLEVMYLKGKIEKLDRRYDDSLRTFDVLAQSNSTDYSDKAIYQKALVMLEKADWRGSDTLLSLITPASPLFPMASALSKEIGAWKDLPQKSPAVAGALAALIPGAGHLYVERPQDALVSFLLNGSFIWGTVELFRHDDYMAGGILAFFELAWYSGNIYSAISSAYKFNRSSEDDLLKKLRDRYSLSFYQDKDTAGILISQRF